jgi:hypothetical protein
MYIAWLIFLKPQSKRKYILAQAGVALFTGITSIFIMSYNWPTSLVVILIWIVGYATAKHILHSYDDEDHILLLSSIWGLMLAEVGWLAYHWTIAYKLPIFDNILLPQVSVIVSCLGFVLYKAYDSYYHYQKIRINDIILPLIFTISITMVLVLAFNNLPLGII